MINIRFGTFETNSSSTHSLCICTEDEYEKWKNGEMVYDDDYQSLHPLTEENSKKLIELNHFSRDELSWDDYEFTTRNLAYDAAKEYHDYLEYYDHYFTTPSGDEMVAFGWYGHD